MERFGLTEVQAQAILELRLRALTGLERQRDQGRARRPARADRRAARDPRRRGAGCWRVIKEELLEIREPVRGRPPHRDHAGRGRDRPRAADRRGGHGHLDHGKRLHQAAAADHLPHAGPRRGRRDGHGHSRRTTTSSTCSSPRPTTTCCSSRRVGKVYRVKVHELPTGHAPVQGPRAGQRAAAAPGRARAGRDRHARLQRGPLPAVRDPQRHRQEDRVQGLRHGAQGRRHHRAQDPRGRRADRRAPDRRRRRHPDGLAQRLGRAVLRARRAADGPRHHRRRRA